MLLAGEIGGTERLAPRCGFHRIAPWQNRVKTLLIGAIGVSFERKADSPNY